MGKQNVMCFVCDNCFEEIEVGMKWGSDGNSFIPDNVEEHIAYDLDGKNVNCKNCGEDYKIATVVTRDLILVQ